MLTRLNWGPVPKPMFFAWHYTTSKHSYQKYSRKEKTERHLKQKAIQDQCQSAVWGNLRRTVILVRVTKKDIQEKLGFPEGWDCSWWRCGAGQGDRGSPQTALRTLVTGRSNSDWFYHSPPAALGQVTETSYTSLSSSAKWGNSNNSSWSWYKG